MRVGVLGAGFWAKFQIAGWQEISGVEIVAIADSVPVRALNLANEFGIPNAYGGISEMLDHTKMDCLDVVTSVEGHFSAVMSASERGLPVICQKPMATRLTEAQEMVERCFERRSPFYIHENWRYQVPIREVFQILKSGEIGDPFRGRIQFSCSFPVFENQPALRELPHFILTDMGSHILDVARFLFGEAKDLFCRTSRVAEDISGEDVATVIMNMERCPMVICEMSYASRLKGEAFPETFITIEGSLGSIELGKSGCVSVTTKKGTMERQVLPQHYAWADPAYSLVHASIVDCNRALALALAQEKEPETSGKDNLRTVELVFKSYESAATDRKITLNPLLGASL